MDEQVIHQRKEALERRLFETVERKVLAFAEETGRAVSGVDVHVIDAAAFNDDTGVRVAGYDDIQVMRGDLDVLRIQCGFANDRGLYWYLLA